MGFCGDSFQCLAQGLGWQTCRAIEANHEEFKALTRYYPSQKGDIVCSFGTIAIPSLALKEWVVGVRCLQKSPACVCAPIINSPCELDVFPKRKCWHCRPKASVCQRLIDCCMSIAHLIE